jgi:hypothetical protein
MTFYPADSTDAHELRERVEDENDQAVHDARFVGGWLPDDREGRPRPCPICKPHVARFCRRLRKQLLGRAP